MSLIIENEIQSKKKNKTKLDQARPGSWHYRYNQNLSTIFTQHRRIKCGNIAKYVATQNKDYCHMEVLSRESAISASIKEG